MRERETEGEREGGREDEGGAGRENAKQVPHCQHRAQTHKPWDHDLSRNQGSLNWPSHPDALLVFFHHFSLTQHCSKSFSCSNSCNGHNNSKWWVVLLFLQMRKLKHREVKSLVQSLFSSNRSSIWTQAPVSWSDSQPPHCIKTVRTEALSAVVGSVSAFYSSTARGNLEVWRNLYWCV